jgi:hypothetical protein
MQGENNLDLTIPSRVVLCIESTWFVGRADCWLSADWRIQANALTGIQMVGFREDGL